MRLFILIALSFLTSSLTGVSLAAPLTDEERIPLIRGLQALRNGKEVGDLEEQTGEITAAVEGGDEGLAYQVIRAGHRMLDNEAYTAVLATALLTFPDRALATFEYMSADTRTMMLDTVQNVDSELFESKEKAARFSRVVKDLIAKSVKIEEKLQLSDGRPAFIDDPDGYTNLRLEPSTKAPIIDQIRTGEEFLVIREVGDWCLVNSPRRDIAYVHKSRVHYKFAN